MRLDAPFEEEKENTKNAKTTQALEMDPKIVGLYYAVKESEKITYSADGLKMPKILAQATQIIKNAIREYQ